MEGKARRGVNLQTRKAIDIPAKFDLPTSPIFTTGGEGGIRTLETKLGHSYLPELTCIFACK